MVEYFVPIEPDDPPKDLVVVAVDVPDHVSRLSLAATKLPENWRQSPSPAGLAVIGDGFVAEQKAAVLLVPSVLAPSESNWLINPRHPEFRHVRVQAPKPFQYDVRFFA